MFLAPWLLVKNIKTYHVEDVTKFGEWSLVWSLDPTRMYTGGAYCNYPMLGVYFSAGLLAHLYQSGDYNEIAEIHQDFRQALTVFDGLIGLAAASLLLLLGVRPAFPLALLLVLWPSSWIATVFGQIDSATQLFLLGAFAGLFGAIHFTRQKRSVLALVTYALGTGLALGGLLVKQLFIISLPGLGLAWAAASFTLWRGGVRPGHLALVNFGALVLFFYPDFVIQRPEDSLSHIFWIYTGEASNHGERIASNGFNLWVLWDRDHWDDSSNLTWIMGLSPRRIGMVAFLFIAAPLIALFARGSLRGMAGGDLFRDPLVSRRWMASLLLLTALLNLAFNVFMTGAHGRHLHHFFHLALIGLLFFFTDSRRPFALLSAGVVLVYGLFYAGFIWSLIGPIDMNLVKSVTARAWITAGLLGYLTVFWFFAARPVARSEPAAYE